MKSQLSKFPTNAALAGPPQTVVVTKTLPGSVLTSYATETLPGATSVITSTISEEFTTTLVSTEAPSTVSTPQWHGTY